MLQNIFNNPSNPKKNDGCFPQITFKELNLINKLEVSKITNAFLLFNQLARDFRKIITEIQNQSELGQLIENCKFRILLIGKENETNPNNRAYYIGISMQCCFNCEHVLKSINECKLLEKSLEIILVRGFHKISFKNWIQPDFLNTYTIIYMMYMESLNQEIVPKGHKVMEASISTSFPDQEHKIKIWSKIIPNNLNRLI